MSFSDRLRFFTRSAWVSFRRPQLNRDTAAVVAEYDSGWEQYGHYLESAKSIDDWMCVPGVEDVAAEYYVDGSLCYQPFHSGAYYRDRLWNALQGHFPDARSITEYGCGVGRNLLFVKQKADIDCYGYELCQPGVDVARAAASKFGFKVEYAQLDYVNNPREEYAFPPTDVAFTMFSLEQLPRSNGRALRNILDRVRLGTIHIEPVPENYPWSLRGILGRIDHRKVDYLSGFDSAVRSLGLKDIHVERLMSAHNPLMSPSVYVLRKI
jgi:SAM-dependent methyltransferase